MGCELWAVDPEAGEAILRESAKWYLSAMDRSWNPIELEAPEGVLEWSLRRVVVPVGRDYETRDEAVIVARKVCRTAWWTRINTRNGINRIVITIEAERRLRHAADPAGWSLKFPEINSAALELDRYFQLQGFTPEESLELICQALQKLRESGDWSASGRELHLLLRKLAGAVQREVRRRSHEISQAPRLSDYARRRLAQGLNRLPLDVLEILICWADSNHDEEEIATLLRVSSNEVRGALETLGQPTETLRGVAFAELCKEAYRRDW